ncbi:MAG: hypothetical protein E4H00_05370 [Myxococcales bacterium]|nr:MAG: hypothetical protein E4H00_05370 [Myxococcales bacterium]
MTIVTPLAPWIAEISLSSRRRSAVLLALFAAGAWIQWINGPFVRSVAMDNQIYYYIADQVAAGVPPHVSLLDHKHALSAMLSGWTMAAGRVIGVDDIVSMRVLSMVATATVAPALWLIAYGVTRNAVVAHVAALTALGFDDFYSQGAAGVRPQVFMAVFMVQAFLALHASRFALAGAAAMAAFLCWQPALIVCGAMAAALAIGTVALRKLSRFSFGASSVLLLYESYFAFIGALGPQIFQSYLLRANLTGHVSAPLWDSFTFIVRDGRWGLGWRIAIPLTFLAVLFSIAVAAVLRPAAMWRAARRDAVVTSLVVAASLATAFTLFEHQACPDRFFLQPFIALASGVVWGAAIAWALFRSSGRHALSLAMVLFWIGTLVSTVFAESYHPRRSDHTLADQRDLAQRTRRLHDEYGFIGAVGCPHMLALAGLENYDPVGLVIDPRVREYLAATGGEEGYRPTPKPMPAVLLTSRGGEAEAFPWLRKEYWPVPDAAYQAQGIRVWLRKECLVERKKCLALFECEATSACRMLGHALPAAAASKGG